MIYVICQASYQGINMKLRKLYRSRLILLLISIILLQTAIPPSLSAMDLMEAYTRAKKSDPLFGSSVYPQ
jgi:hypothetical protein